MPGIGSATKFICNTRPVFGLITAISCKKCNTHVCVWFTCRLPASGRVFLLARVAATSWCRPSPGQSRTPCSRTGDSLFSPPILSRGSPSSCEEKWAVIWRVSVSNCKTTMTIQTIHIEFTEVLQPRPAQSKGLSFVYYPTLGIAPIDS